MIGDLSAALMVAMNVHCDQRDLQGEPYLRHILRVVSAVSGEAKVVAALHDVLEDSDDYTPRELEIICDLSRAQRAALEIITRKNSESYLKYIDFIDRQVANQGKIAREVKIADIKDNLNRIPAPNWPSLKKRYEKALEILT